MSLGDWWHDDESESREQRWNLHVKEAMQYHCSSV
jgi:hypothetical protein